MGAKTAISWCDSTFNPFIGCTKVSPGCAHCYAETMDRRWGKDRWGPGKARTRTSPAYWRQPLAWNKAAEKAGERHRVFCGSMCDVFDPEVDPKWRDDLFTLIHNTPALDWLLLTKRPENILAMCPGGFPHWENIWLGTTVEDQQRANERIPLLLDVPAAVHFLSCEPLLERVSFEHPSLDRALSKGIRLDWVIVGGESGQKARPFHLNWARAIVHQCKAAGVPVFVKQLGSVGAVFETPRGDLVSRRLLDRAGADPAEWPEDLRVREFPAP